MRSAPTELPSQPATPSSPGVAVASAPTKVRPAPARKDQRRVTQNDIARAAGVHNTTVSLALRNSQAIPAATRQRIQEIAQQMGYYPDPALRALIAYRDSRRTKACTATLAYLTNGEAKWDWQNLPGRNASYAAAQQRATDLGYHVEHFWMGEAGMSARRLDSMLLHRGINGVIVAFHQRERDLTVGLDWSRLCAVNVGPFPLYPAVHQVCIDQPRLVSLAVGKLRACGYKRIGFVICHGADRLADEGWARAIHGEQFSLPATGRLPVLSWQQDADVFSASQHAAMTSLNLMKWYKLYRPEVIVATSPAVLFQVQSCGLSVPRDVSYVDLSPASTATGGPAGMHPHSARLGELAVEVLATQLQMNQFGVPAVPTVTSVAGEWVDGDTLAVPAPADATVIQTAI